MNKPDREKQVQHGIIYMWNLGGKKERTQIHRNTVEKWLPGSRVEGEWGEVGLRVQTSVYNVSKSWDLL